MFEALNPAFWWGATAISAPIIIHLINRLRYRRIRWAAMEFLLKSQQRNKRKLIIEQLILLALRCLLVFLFVLLVVRPLWLLSQEASKAELPAYHVVVLDDTLSMQDLEDPQRAEGQTAFRDGVRLVLDLVQKASESPSAHYFTVLRLSELTTPEMGRPLERLQNEPPGQQVSAESLRDLRNRLETLECSYLRVHPGEGIKKAQEYLALVDEGNKYLHVVGDFRRRDWTESDAEEMCQLLALMAHPQGGRVQVRLHDVARPQRTDNRQEVPPGHFNLGIVNLRADARVVTPGVRVRLTASVKNFADLERTGVRLAVKVDGAEKNEFARVLDRISGGEQKEDVHFDLTFSNEDRLGLKQIAISIDDRDHLAADNARYTYVELRKEIPVLLVDPDLSSPISDSGYLDRVFNEKTNLKTERIRPGELKNRKDLDQYPVIFLLNVPGVGTNTNDLDPDGLKLLEGYVRRGGNLVFFLGPRVNPASYNEHLYRNGQGIFPVPLNPRPEPGRRYAYVEDPPDPEDISHKLRFLRPDHPAFRIYKERSDFLYFLTINCYFKVDPGWKPGENTTVVAQLANRQPLSAYAERSLDLVRRLRDDRSRFSNQVNEHGRKIAQAVVDAPTARARKGPLIEAVGGLLDDPALVEYWKDASPQRQELRRTVAQFHETLITGDPLIIEAELGKGRTKGRVVAFMTSAAPTPIERKDYDWNNWATLMDPSQFVPYVLVMGELHRYLAASARSATQMEINHLLGTDVDVRLDKERYDARMGLFTFKEGGSDAVKVADITGAEGTEEVTARVVSPRAPGFYVLRLNQPSADRSTTPKGEPEDRPMAFNVDCRAEGLLGRVSEAELRERLAAGLTKGDLKLSSHEGQSFVSGLPRLFVPRGAAEVSVTDQARNKSWSDYAWVLLLFIVLLLVEQWFASRLSYHIRGGELTLPAGRGRTA